MVAWDQVWGRGVVCKWAQGNFWGAMKMFYSFIGVVITQMHSFVIIH